MPTNRTTMRRIRETLRLHLQGGLSYSEIGRSLRISKGVVGKDLLLARGQASIAPSARRKATKNSRPASNGVEMGTRAPAQPPLLQPRRTQCAHRLAAGRNSTHRRCGRCRPLVKLINAFCSEAHAYGLPDLGRRSCEAWEEVYVPRKKELIYAEHQHDFPDSVRQESPLTAFFNFPGCKGKWDKAVRKSLHGSKDAVG